METVLIADDEENIREGIKLIIDWEELGFEIAGDASNGEEALLAIQKLNPSLVVMDMQMPKLHGIDVIKKARALGYSGYFIILSGYSDFSYAQDAIRNRVTNYITKPVDEDELLETVKKIKTEIEESVKAGERRGKIQSKAKSVVVQELLLGNYADKAAKESGRGLNDDQLQELSEMKLLGSMYQVMIYETYHSGKGSGGSDFASARILPELLKTFLDKDSFEVCNVDGYEAILLKGKVASSKVEDFINHYKKDPIESDSPLDAVFIALGKAVSDPMEIEESFESAKRLADRRFFCHEGEHVVSAEGSAVASGDRALGKVPGAGNAGNEGIGKQAGDDIFGGKSFGKASGIETSTNDTPSAERLSKDYQAEETGKILDAVISGSRSQIINEMENLSEYLASSGAGSSDVCLYLTEILLHMKDRLTKQYPKLSDIFDTHAGIIEFIEGRFYQYEIIQYMTEIMDAVMERLHAGQGSENIIEDIISYTDRNYAQPLTLEDLAAKFGYNSGYLGRLFTKTTGTGYNYYLNECRITKAKEFLAEGKYKVYEVAQMVGYNDVDYFGKKFRKHAGMTPAEFKKQSSLG